jgi:hypothetical protein
MNGRYLLEGTVRQTLHSNKLEFVTVTTRNLSNERLLQMGFFIYRYSSASNFHNHNETGTGRVFQVARFLKKDEDTVYFQLKGIAANLASQQPNEVFQLLRK